MQHSWTKSRTSPNAEMIWQAFNTEHFIYLSVGLSTVPLQTHAITLLPPPIILVQVNIGFLCPCFVYFRIQTEYFRCNLVQSNVAFLFLSVTCGLNPVVNHQYFCLRRHLLIVDFDKKFIDDVLDIASSCEEVFHNKGIICHKFWSNDVLVTCAGIFMISY